MGFKEFYLSEGDWFLVDTRYMLNLTGHTSKPNFSSEKDALAYKKKFSHVPGFKDKTVKAVQGKSDKNGYVTPLTESITVQNVKDLANMCSELKVINNSTGKIDASPKVVNKLVQKLQKWGYKQSDVSGDSITYKKGNSIVGLTNKDSHFTVVVD